MKRIRPVLAATAAAFAIAASHGVAQAAVGPPGTPRPHFVVGVTSWNPVVVKVAWKPSATSGACYSFERNDYGGLTPVQLSDPRATNVIVTEDTTDWDIFGFQVQAYDCADPTNQSPWTAGPLYGSWDGPNTAVITSGTWNGSYTAQRGASFTIDTCCNTFANIGWSARKGPLQGKAKVYVDGVYRATVNLHSRRSLDYQMVWTAAWPTFGQHTIKVVNLATQGHPRINWEWMPSFQRCGC